MNPLLMTPKYQKPKYMKHYSKTDALTQKCLEKMCCLNILMVKLMIKQQLQGFVTWR